ncbi:MAG: guanylate kinase [Candidatus Sericytochromatia bacterium]|nr:guanylate kinase [Candidatus Sericytochromatia bacterium]
MNLSIDAHIQQLQSVSQASLIVVSGPSGAGKGTIVNQALQRLHDVRLSVSMTTRPPRPGEVEGQSYFFTDHAHFETLIEHGAFLEYARYNGNYYGTPKAFVMEALQAGQDVILEIEVQGAEQVRQNWAARMVQIFVLPPSETDLKARLTGRQTESPEAIAQRLEKVTQECAQIPHYDYYIINDQLTDAVDDMLAIVRAERQKIKKESVL